MNPEEKVYTNVKEKKVMEALKEKDVGEMILFINQLHARFLKEKTRQEGFFSLPVSYINKST